MDKFMIRIVAAISVMLFCSINCLPVLANDEFCSKTMIKMSKYWDEKKYDKALKAGLKVKQKCKLSEKEKKDIQEIMESIYFVKSKDDALKAFYVYYDKYEDYYIYKDKSYIYDDVSPYIIVKKDVVLYFLKFKVVGCHNRRIHFNKVILHSDNKNITMNAIDSSDELVSYQAQRRVSTATVLLTAAEMYKVLDAIKGNDVSFRMSGEEGHVESIVFTRTKELIKKSVTLYEMLLIKAIKPGDFRY